MLLAPVQISDSGDGQYLLTACRGQATTIEHEPEQPDAALPRGGCHEDAGCTHDLFKSYLMLLGVRRNSYSLLDLKLISSQSTAS